MVTLNHVKDFLRVAWAIDLNVIKPMYGHADKNGYGRTYNEYLDVSQSPFFHERDSTVIENMACFLRIGINKFEPENFDFSKFIDILYAEERSLEADTDIHNRLTHPSVIDLPVYFKPEILFPRIHLASKHINSKENHSESKAIELAFSKEVLIPEIEIDCTYGDYYYDEVYHHHASYSLANNSIFKKINETGFIVEINRLFPNFISKFSNNLLKMVYPLYKKIIKREELVKEFANEFELAKFMCLKALAEAMYVYLYELSMGVNRKDFDLIEKDNTRAKIHLDKVLNSFKSRHKRVNGVEVDSHDNLVVEARALYYKIALRESIIGLIQRSNGNYLIIKSIFRISYNVFYFDMRSADAINIVNDFLLILGEQYSESSIKVKVKDYKDWYFYDGTNATENNDEILSTAKLILRAYGVSRKTKKIINNVEDESTLFDAYIQQLVDELDVR